MKMKIVVLASFLFIGSALAGKDSSEYLDLTFAFNKDTVLWPGRYSTFNTEFEGKTPDGFWVSSKGFCTSEHTSTHIDAPYHFNQKGMKLDEIPFETLIDVPGVMIDIYDKVHTFENGELKVVDNYVLKKDDIIEWEKKNGQIPSGAVILLRTGWGSRWPDKYSYLGQDKPKEEANAGGADNSVKEKEKPTVDLSPKLRYPGYSAEAAKFLVVERQALGAGIDCISIDPGYDTKFLAHQFFQSRNKYLLENVANLHLLPPRGFRLWIVPFKIDQGTGSPTRVIAKITDEKYKKEKK